MQNEENQQDKSWLFLKDNTQMLAKLIKKNSSTYKQYEGRKRRKDISRDNTQIT